MDVGQSQVLFMLSSLPDLFGAAVSRPCRSHPAIVESVADILTARSVGPALAMTSVAMPTPTVMASTRASIRTG